MFCCGYDRKTRFCCHCGKELLFYPVKNMISYLNERLNDREKSLYYLKNKKNCFGNPNPSKQIIINKIKELKACIEWLESKKDSDIGISYEEIKYELNDDN